MPPVRPGWPHANLEPQRLAFAAAVDHSHRLLFLASPPLDRYLRTTVVLPGYRRLPGRLRLTARPPRRRTTRLLHEAMQGTGSQRPPQVDPASERRGRQPSPRLSAPTPDEARQPAIRAPTQRQPAGERAGRRYRVQLRRPADRSGDQQRDGRPVARELQHRPRRERQCQLFHLQAGGQAAGAVDPGNPVVLDRQRHDQTGQPLRDPAGQPGGGGQAGAADEPGATVQRPVGAAVSVALYLRHRDAETAQAVRP